MTRTLRISATLFAALLLTTGTQVASASQRLASGTLVPNVAPTATLTVSPTQTTAPVGASIDLSGHLTLSDGAGLTGHTIHLLETAPGGVETDIGTASTNVFGAFYFAVPNTLSPAGHWSFRATFDGESTYLPTDATTGVDVGNPPPSLTLGTSAATILLGGHVTVTATLGAWHSNDQVSIYGTTGGGAQRRGELRRHLRGQPVDDPQHRLQRQLGGRRHLPAGDQRVKAGLRAREVGDRAGGLLPQLPRGAALPLPRQLLDSLHALPPLHRGASAQHGREGHPVHPPAAQLRPWRTVTTGTIGTNV